jgi:hypothetical protein
LDALLLVELRVTGHVVDVGNDPGQHPEHAWKGLGGVWGWGFGCLTVAFVLYLAEPTVRGASKIGAEAGAHDRAAARATRIGCLPSTRVLERHTLRHYR